MALEIFRAISNLRMVLDSETDADSPDNETTFKAMREMIEILFQLTLDTGDSGTATENPTETTLTDSGAAYDVDEHNGRTLLMCSGNAKGNFYTIDDTTATTIVCTGDTLLADGVLSGDDYKILFDIKTHTSGHTHDAVNSAAPTLADASVTQAKLKTSMSAVSHTGDTDYTHKTLPGGEYGFYPQVKVSDAAAGYCATMYEITPQTTNTSYVTNVVLRVGDLSYTVYAQQRYVTSSGEVYWIFILRDKSTKKVFSVWHAPDHPCFGNGGKPQLVPHPHGDFDENIHEMIVINPSKEQVLEMMEKTVVESETEPDKDLIDIIIEEYEIDETTEPDWPKEKVTVGLPPDWQEKPMGSMIIPIKKIIPKPDMVKTATLKLKKIKGVEL